MLLSEIASKGENKKPDGTYVGVYLDEESKDNLYEMAKAMDVNEPLPKNKYHITVIYSRKYLDKFEPLGKLDDPIVAKIKGLEIFSARNGKNALVVELDCPELVKRHKEIMKTHGATYDWDEYKCHVTLSYDAKDFDVKENNPKKHVKEVKIIKEYSEDLQLDWLVNSE